MFSGAESVKRWDTPHQPSMLCNYYCVSKLLKWRVRLALFGILLQEDSDRRNVMEENCQKFDCSKETGGSELEGKDMQNL